MLRFITAFGVVFDRYDLFHIRDLDMILLIKVCNLIIIVI